MMDFGDEGEEGDGGDDWDAMLQGSLGGGVDGDAALSPSAAAPTEEALTTVEVDGAAASSPSATAPTEEALKAPTKEEVEISDDEEEGEEAVDDAEENTAGAEFMEAFADLHEEAPASRQTPPKAQVAKHPSSRPPVAKRPSLAAAAIQPLVAATRPPMMIAAGRARAPSRLPSAAARPVLDSSVARQVTQPLTVNRTPRPRVVQPQPIAPWHAVRQPGVASAGAAVRMPGKGVPRLPPNSVTGGRARGPRGNMPPQAAAAAPAARGELAAVQKGGRAAKGAGRGRGVGGDAGVGEGCAPAAKAASAAPQRKGELEDLMQEAIKELGQDAVDKVIAEAKENAEKALQLVPESAEKQAKLDSVKQGIAARSLKKLLGKAGDSKRPRVASGSSTIGGGAGREGGDEVADTDLEGRHFDLTQIVVNFANVGANYGTKILGRQGGGLFDWEGVRRCCQYLRHERAWKIIGVINENFRGTDGGRDRVPVPDDIRKLCEHIQETPRIVGANHSSADDEMTIKCAYRRNSRFLDNDNYRDWQQQMRDEKIRDWFKTFQNLLHSRYYFDVGTGGFELLDGNVPAHLLAAGVEMDKQQLWTASRY